MISVLRMRFISSILQIRKMRCEVPSQGAAGCTLGLPIPRVFSIENRVAGSEKALCYSRPHQVLRTTPHVLADRTGAVHRVRGGAGRC